jgi:hypothetical protein
MKLEQVKHQINILCFYETKIFQKDIKLQYIKYILG